MIEVFIPSDNIPEREYAIHVILSEYLGVDYTLHPVDDQTDYTLKVKGCILRINDAFFGKHPEESAYLSAQNIPEGSAQCNSEELEGVQLIYGEDKFIRASAGDQDKIILESANDEDKIIRESANSGDTRQNTSSRDSSGRAKRIYCGVDLFASAFFMLTRWEEYVLKDRDEHGRFPSSSSLARKAGFTRKPVVNAYATLLKNLLIESGVDESDFRKHTYRFTLTVDIDFPRHWKPGPQVLKKIIGTAVRTGSVRATKDKLASFREYQQSGKDIYDTFDYLMDCAEANGQKASFFFMTGGEHKLDPGNTLADPSTLAIAEIITGRGHSCGLHPSYMSSTNGELFSEETDKYESVMGEAPLIGRQHFLRFEVPETWRLWEGIGAQWESSMGYTDDIGFRCGTCYPFPVFDVVQRRMLSLVEKPLIVMDVALRHQLDLTPDEAIVACAEVRAEVEKYNGEFVVLWHNSSFGDEEWPNWGRVVAALCY